MHLFLEKVDTTNEIHEYIVENSLQSTIPKA